MSQIIIPDEWFIHDLIGDNGECKQRQTFSFITKVEEKCDRIAVLVGGKFIEKYYNLLMKDNRLEIRKISRYFRLSFLRNSDKCKRIISVTDLTEDLNDKIEESDKDLYRIRQTLGEGKIITTDESLMFLPNTFLRDKFLKEY